MTDNTGKPKLTPELLQRIRKCLALAKSDNPHEAAAALRQAQKLMQMYGLGNEEIRLAALGESAVGNRSASLPKWHGWLVSTVARAFGCQSIISGGLGGTQILFVGRHDRCEIAAYTYTVMRRHVLAARQRFITSLPPRCKTHTKTLRADSYCEGFVLALAEQAEQLAMEDEERAVLETYLQRRFGMLGKAGYARDTANAQRARNRQPDYRSSGYHDGRQVEVRRGMRGRRPTLLEQQP